MGFFTSKEFNTLDELLLHELHDLYDAEHRISKALPKMEEAAHSPQLKAAFSKHLHETEGQIERLKRAFQLLGHDAKGETCEATKGLIAEGEEMVEAKGDDAVKDAALIIAAQRVEHYEISAYGSARTHARQLGKTEVAELLQQTLDEESATDDKLTELAESGINLAAQ